MKSVVVVAIALSAGCYVVPHHTGGGECPTTHDGSSSTIEGSPCDVDHLCFVENDFSPCMSGWYRCDNGGGHFDHDIDAETGKSCVESPLSFCAYEGNPSCDIDPTASSCGCGADGTWNCLCFCYSDLGTCGRCPARFDAQLEGTLCGPIGNACPLSGHTCTCVDDNNGDAFGKFHCI